MKRILTAVVLLGGMAGAGDKPKVRVFLADHESWQQGSALVAGTYSGATKTEQVNTLTKVCPSVIITEDPAKADLLLRWDSKTWQQTSWGSKMNQFTLYNSERDMIGSGGADRMKNAAKDICKLITSSLAK